MGILHVFRNSHFASLLKFWLFIDKSFLEPARHDSGMLPWQPLPGSPKQMAFTISLANQAETLAFLLLEKIQKGRPAGVVSARQTDGVKDNHRFGAACQFLGSVFAGSKTNKGIGGTKWKKFGSLKKNKGLVSPVMFLPLFVTAGKSMSLMKRNFIKVLVDTKMKSSSLLP